MNILQAGSAELHSRWHCRAYQKPMVHGQGKGMCLIVYQQPAGGFPVTCTPPASGQSQGHYALIGHINRPFEIKYWCLRDRPHEETACLQCWFPVHCQIINYINFWFHTLFFPSSSFEVGRIVSTFWQHHLLYIFCFSIAVQFCGFKLSIWQ